ncbi:unannotated protein [freshwater metagenome]|uniref:Unannotated protein n=1 Tax=freshwater metagenome TaxID=449393 RepID=A0A6J6FE69_9ZZZZ
MIGTGGAMKASANDKSPSELTTTISLTSLRQVPHNADVATLFASLSEDLIELLAAVDENSAMLIALGGAGSGARFLLNSDAISIGRDQSSEIFFDDITVSRKHCLVTRNNNEFSIEDLKSLNGTYVNAQAITRTSLRTGDELHIGKYRLTFFQGQHKKGE